MHIVYKSFAFGKFNLLYLTDQETGQVSMVPLPAGMEPCYDQRRETLDIPELRRNALPCPAWEVGSLVHLSLTHHPQSNGAGCSLLGGASTRALRFDTQQVSERDGHTEIRTRLTAPEGYAVDHIVSHDAGADGIEVETVFYNHTARALRLDLLTSFALDGLSPFAVDDGSARIRLHRFYGGWSREGRRRVDTLEALSLERPWYNTRPESERFGVVGSFPVDRYFPVAVVEDAQAGVFWAAQLAVNSSWQMELCRTTDCLVFAGGLADREFGSWSKVVAPGGSFAAPKAFLAVGAGLQETLNRMTRLHQKYALRQPASEQTLPVVCNEWCTSWGRPTQAEILALAQRLQGTSVGYVVIDAGWSQTTNPHLGQGGNGDWVLDRTQFPDGLRALSRSLRAMGLGLGIWFEFEVTTRGARVYGPAYDHLHLRRDGEVIVTGDGRSFWDFRQPQVLEFLRERVLEFLRNNEITYLKVDYNGSIGIGCDGAESLGEGLRQQMEAVGDFFSQLRSALPALVIESCASGGHRLTPAWMDRTALSSSTDAHECLEIPILAANADLLILPRQNLIWCVLDESHPLQQIRYRLSAGFLGRLAISGDILTLAPQQWALGGAALLRRCPHGPGQLLRVAVPGAPWREHPQPPGDAGRPLPRGRRRRAAGLPQLCPVCRGRASRPGASAEPSGHAGLRRHPLLPRRCQWADGAGHGGIRYAGTLLGGALTRYPLGSKDISSREGLP